MYAWWIRDVCGALWVRIGIYQIMSLVRQSWQLLSIPIVERTRHAANCVSIQSKVPFLASLESIV